MTPIEQLIRRKAAERGFDPDIIIRGVNTEGGVKDPVRRSGARKNGVLEPSYGPFQMLIGGPGTGYPEGLGNVALSKGIDPRNPAHLEATVDLAMDTLAKEGWAQWYGPKNAKIGRWDGIRKGAMGKNAGSHGIPGLPASSSMDFAKPGGIPEQTPVVDTPYAPSGMAINSMPQNPILGGIQKLLAGGASQQRQQAPSAPVGGSLAGFEAADAGRMQAASALMNAILMSRRGKIPGLSING